MLRNRGPDRMLPCAPALLAAALTLVIGGRCAADDQPAAVITTPQEAPNDASNNDVISNVPQDENAGSLPAGVLRLDQPPESEPWLSEYEENWSWHWVPTGLVYHSYMAGVHEPRMGFVGFSNLDGRMLADASLGGRVGFVRYGNDDPVNPDGYQLDFYGAAIARLDLENQQDLDATDYVFGFPLTWGDEQWQWKFGYAHLSSHLGDEFAISHPGSLNNRVNYVRDSFVLGTSYYVSPEWRVYGEVGWAFHADGGAEPFESQFGTELCRPGPTDGHFFPFLAINGRIRQDDDFSGDVTLQAGWLRRNILGQTLRFGGQYYSGNSNQFEFFGEYEQQLGAGIWYDF